MKNPFYYLLFIGALLVSCATYKADKHTNAISFPELSSIVKKDKDVLLNSTAQQVGMPIWSSPIKVTVQQLPFNKISYVTYAEYMQKAAKINSIPYVDSLPYKPKYLRLQLLDKIELTSLLNSQENESVRHYLEKDADYKMVTKIDFTVPETLMPMYEEAETILLQQDELKNIYLILKNGVTEERVHFSHLQVFDYELSCFCWGVDRYDQKRIENMVSDTKKCPKGTFEKASKIDTDKSYLKFK